MQYYCFHFMIRLSNLQSNPFHMFGRLTQQFVVDAFSKIESHRLQYILHNQGELRAELYSEIQNAIRQGESIVGRKILPSSFVGGPRYMKELYQDAMAIIREKGNPDLFITITCNPNWPEIQRSLLEGQTASDRPDIVARVFNAKLKAIIDDLKNNSVFGPVVADISTVEFQKRGLPHCHLLLILAPYAKIRDHFDHFVYAEIPDPNTNPALYDAVIKHMVHNPCHENARSPCLNHTTKKCSKGYPKKFANSSSRDEKGFPLYRRRRNGYQGEKFVNGKQIRIDNSNVVPYNPYLLQKYDCHINVEVCSTIASVKYLFKYIHKGGDRACVDIRNESNEVKKYVTGRYLAPIEAAWRIFGFKLTNRSHTVMRLPVHLPQHQYVRFDQNENLERVLQRNERTKLTEFFQLCRDDPVQFGNFCYHEVPKVCKWNTASRKWVLRRQIHRRTIARMHPVSPMEGERFYLRLLLTKVKGPKSFKCVLSYRRVTYETFKEAAIARGLVSDDSENEAILAEAASYQMPRALRATFAGLLLFNHVNNPVNLWQKFLIPLTEDLARDASIPISQISNVAAGELDSIMKTYNSTIRNFLPHLLPAERPPVENAQMQIYLQYKDHLTPQQRQVYDHVMAAARNETSQRMFFLDAPAGTGKTFTFLAIASQLIAQGFNVVSVASSACGANLLLDGNTAHTTFKIPLNCSENSFCAITPNSELGKFMASVDVIFWDEAPMSHRFNVEAVDRTLRDLCGNSRPFGNIVSFFSGDFRQTLPVIPAGSIGDILNATLKNSFLWSHFHQMTLTVNLRNRDEAFNSFLMRVGDDQEEKDDFDEIAIPQEIHIDETVDALIESTYPGLLSTYATSSHDEIAHYLTQRVILAPRNDMVSTINDFVIGQLPREAFSFYSSDSVEDSHAASSVIQPEILNMMNPSGMPPHHLLLKLHMPVILLRNLNKKRGLCNGTRLMIMDIRQRVLKVRILSGSFQGDEHFIFRIPLKHSDPRKPFRLVRKQFPIHPCFAMTINKAQGQSLEYVGVHLLDRVFSHGQLYVALSRVTDPRNLSLCIATARTRNIVFRQVLERDGVG